MMARRIAYQPAGDALAWVGMTALGYFSSLLTLTVARDVMLMLLTGAHMLWPRAFSFASWRDGSAAAVIIVALLLTLAGFVNARRCARVLTVNVPISGLPPKLDGFTIVQISDLHAGTTIKQGYVDAIVKAVNALHPDLVALTGDIIDGRVAHLAAHVRPLGQLRARYGAYLVLGNHEYYSDAPAWVAEFQRLGLRVLLNEHVVIGAGGARLILAGVTDYSAARFDPAQRSSPAAALAGAPDEVKTRVLLAHQPRSAYAAADAGFTLQLCGHTHGGQIFPWNFCVRKQQPFTAGLARLGTLWVYTSRGTGYWGPPVRLGAPSEITRIRLVRPTAQR
jgi:predicted MPP superfamily phosphohydrolase